MALPTTVKGYSEAFNVPFVDCLIACKFCLRFLTNLEKAAFDAAPFLLQWTDGCVRGCCQQCIRKCGYLEKAIYFERQVQKQELEKILTQLTEVLVRCQICMRALTVPEKRLCCSEESLIRVRGRVRGLCALCRLF